MHTEKQINSNILNVTMMIAEIFPELSKYTGEMPVKFSYEAGSGINIKMLQDYCDSLEVVFAKYSVDHIIS